MEKYLDMLVICPYIACLNGHTAAKAQSLQADVYKKA